MGFSALNHKGIPIRANASDDIGAMINRALSELPDVEADQWREGCTRTIEVSTCDIDQCDLSIKTPIIPDPKKQYHVIGTGPNGINLHNDTGQDDPIVVEGDAVGQNSHWSNFSLRGGNMVFEGSVRGKSSVKDVMFIDSPGGAITLRDAAATGLGPVGVRMDDNHFIGCRHAYVVDATTYLLFEIRGGRIWETSDTSILLNAASGVTIDNVDFTASSGAAYIHLLADNGPILLTDISRCRFGGEATPREGLPSVANILFGETAAGSQNAISKVTILNNDFNGSDTTANVPGTIPHAIAFNERPREILVDNQNRFERAYGVSLVGEGWTGGQNPQQVGGGSRQLRNHWGNNVIQSAGLVIPVFENGGVGWEQPKIDMNFSGYSGPSVTRMMSPNGQHWLHSVDNTGAPTVTAAAYL